MSESTRDHNILCANHSCGLSEALTVGRKSGLLVQTTPVREGSAHEANLLPLAARRYFRCGE